MPGSAKQDQPRTYFDPIAQTIPQIYAQMRLAGFGADDLLRIRRAYALILSIHACQSRGSGRSIIEHLLGATSAVIRLGANADLVTATLAHAVYVHGDFGGFRKRCGEKERARVRAAIGDSAEEIVLRYSKLRWSPEKIAELYAQPGPVSAADHQIVTIRLCDQIDLYATREALYAGNAEQRRHFIRANGNALVALAERLGYPELARCLRGAYDATLAPSIPRPLTHPPWRDGVILPPSYCSRPPIALYRSVRTAVWRWSGR